MNLRVLPQNVAKTKFYEIPIIKLCSRNVSPKAREDKPHAIRQEMQKEYASIEGWLRAKDLGGSGEINSSSRIKWRPCKMPGQRKLLGRG